MLSLETINEIKKIASAISVNGEIIKKIFIEKLQKNVPELLHIFYQILQKSGRSKISLIDAVYSAAMQIEHIDRFVPAVMQVAHKHRSLGIQPEHYPIVGQHLVDSIQEALGNQATEAGIAALQLAFNRIADVFIQVEKELYQAVELEGGWRLFKPFRIVKKELKNDGAMVLYIVPLDGKIVPVTEAGKYVSVRIKMPGETYFLNHQYAVAEEKELGGYVLTMYPSLNFHMNDRVTDYILDVAMEGDILEISSPAGLFVLKKTDNPIVFICEGIGTATLKHLVDSLEEDIENPIIFIQYARNQEVVIYQEVLQRKMNQFINGKYEVSYQDNYTDGHLAILPITAHQKNADIYLCGSKSFMDEIVEQLHEEDDNKIQIHRTFFDSTMFL
ncbi:hypothetical protein AEA09_04415 [Lysinibacillus contaminans]|uniref:Globin domain-containing protein n=1 Tax=Lysinibacillus contaminans TaxID=1293441 RepID=A0ABR5JZE3_9BACI|nr:globin domain-containing protein [Lysinibacillus contaminans]KOS67870.1 hypothetical protein AEA09_04415 [Lysinibacillus contaminans]